jgi:hypothetical protein
LEKVAICAGIRPLTGDPGCPSRATRATHASHPAGAFSDISFIAAGKKRGCCAGTARSLCRLLGSGNASPKGF